MPSTLIYQASEISVDPTGRLYVVVIGRFCAFRFSSPAICCALPESICSSPTFVAPQMGFVYVSKEIVG